MYKLLIFDFRAFVIQPPVARGIPVELFLVERIGEAAVGVALTLAKVV